MDSGQRDRDEQAAGRGHQGQGVKGSWKINHRPTRMYDWSTGADEGVIYGVYTVN